MQELRERSRLGIPMVFKSNARNHIDPDTRFGISEAAGAFTAFPKFLKEAGLLPLPWEKKLLPWEKKPPEPESVPLAETCP